MPKIVAQFIFSIRRSHNDTRINASNVSSFNRILWSLFTRLCFWESTFTLKHACQAEVAVNAESKLQSRNCKSYWNSEVFARVLRLESNYVSICKLQPLCFVIGSFWRGLHCGWWKLCRAHFCEVFKKETSLTAKMAFDMCWRLPYWTMHSAVYLFGGHTTQGNRFGPKTWASHSWHLYKFIHHGWRDSSKNKSLPRLMAT